MVRSKAGTSNPKTSSPVTGRARKACSMFSTAPVGTLSKNTSSRRSASMRPRISSMPSSGYSSARRPAIRSGPLIGRPSFFALVCRDRSTLPTLPGISSAAMPLTSMPPRLRIACESEIVSSLAEALAAASSASRAARSVKASVASSVATPPPR